MPRSGHPTHQEARLRGGGRTGAGVAALRAAVGPAAAIGRCRRRTHAAALGGDVKGPSATRRSRGRSAHTRRVGSRELRRPEAVRLMFEDGCSVTRERRDTPLQFGRVRGDLSGPDAGRSRPDLIDRIRLRIDPGGWAEHATTTSWRTICARQFSHARSAAHPVQPEADDHDGRSRGVVAATNAADTDPECPLRRQWSMDRFAQGPVVLRRIVDVAPPLAPGPSRRPGDRHVRGARRRPVSTIACSRRRWPASVGHQLAARRSGAVSTEAAR